MDWKLPSVSRDRPLGEAHSAFLDLVTASRAEVFVKSIVSADTDPNDLEEAAGRVAAVDPGLPLFLQPATEVEDGARPPTVRQLLDWQTLARRTLPWLRAAASR